MLAIDELNKVGLEFDRLEEPLWIEQLQKLADADDPRKSGVVGPRLVPFCWNAG